MSEFNYDRLLQGMPGSESRSVQFQVDTSIGILRPEDVVEAVKFSNDPTFWKVQSRADIDPVDPEVMLVTTPTGSQADEVRSYMSYLGSRPKSTSPEDEERLYDRRLSSQEVRRVNFHKLLDQIVECHGNLPEELQPGFERFLISCTFRNIPVVKKW